MLGATLRGLGSVLNPQVAQELAQEDRDKRDLQLRAPQLMAQMEAMRNEQAFRQEVQSSGGDMVKVAGAAIRHGKPELALNLFNQQEARAARLQTAQIETVRRLAELEMRQQDKAMDRESRERIASEANETRKMLAGLQAELGRSNQQLKAMQFQAGADAKLQKNVQQLQGNLEKANLPQADAVLSDVEKAIDENPASMVYISGKGASLPDWMIPDAAKFARQAAQKLFNITLKDRSGAAVTNQELERLKQEFATGFWKTEEQFKNGVRAARNIINKHYASVAAGSGPEALKAYNENIRQFGGKVVLDPKGDKDDPLGIR